MNTSHLIPDVDQIPDIKYIVDTVAQILEYMSDDEMIKLKDENVTLYEQKIHEKFTDFSDKYFSLFSFLLDGKLESLFNLITMLNALAMVKTGKISMETATVGVREDLSNQYIYPKFGGKKEFERTIIERHNKKKKHNT